MAPGDTSLGRAEPGIARTASRGTARAVQRARCTMPIPCATARSSARRDTDMEGCVGGVCARPPQSCPERVRVRAASCCTGTPRPGRHRGLLLQHAAIPAGLAGAPAWCGTPGGTASRRAQIRVRWSKGQRSKGQRQQANRTFSTTKGRMHTRRAHLFWTLSARDDELSSKQLRRDGQSRQPARLIVDTDRRVQRQTAGPRLRRLEMPRRGACW